MRASWSRCGGWPAGTPGPWNTWTRCCPAARPATPTSPDGSATRSPAAWTAPTAATGWPPAPAWTPRWPRPSRWPPMTSCSRTCWPGWPRFPAPQPAAGRLGVPGTSRSTTRCCSPAGQPDPDAGHTPDRAGRLPADHHHPGRRRDHRGRVLRPGEPSPATSRQQLAPHLAELNRRLPRRSGRPRPGRAGRRLPGRQPARPSPAMRGSSGCSCTGGPPPRWPGGPPASPASSWPGRTGRRPPTGSGGSGRGRRTGPLMCMTCWRPATTCCRPGTPRRREVTEQAVSQLHTWGAWDQEASLIHDTLARLPADSPRQAAWIHQLGILAQARGDYARPPASTSMPSTSSSGSATRPAWPPATTISAPSPRTAGTTTRPPASTSAPWTSTSGSVTRPAWPQLPPARHPRPGPRGLRRGRPPVPARPGHQRADRRPGRHGQRLPPARQPRPGPRGLRRGRPAVPARSGHQRPESVTASMATGYHNLGMLAQIRGDYDEAARQYQRALDISERLGDQAGTARQLYPLGILAQTRGDYDEAARQYQRSLDIIERLGDQADRDQLQPARHPGKRPWRFSRRSHHLACESTRDQAPPRLPPRLKSTAPPGRLPLRNRPRAFHQHPGSRGRQPDLAEGNHSPARPAGQHRRHHGLIAPVTRLPSPLGVTRAGEPPM